MVASQTFVTGHLLVHFLLQMFLLLSLNYGSCSNCCEVFRINCGFVRIKIWTHGKFSWIDLKTDINEDSHIKSKVDLSYLGT